MKLSEQPEPIVIRRGGPGRIQYLVCAFLSWLAGIPMLFLIPLADTAAKILVLVIFIPLTLLGGLAFLLLRATTTIDPVQRTVTAEFRIGPWAQIRRFPFSTIGAVSISELMAVPRGGGAQCAVFLHPQKSSARSIKVKVFAKSYQALPLAEQLSSILNVPIVDEFGHPYVDRG